MKKNFIKHLLTAVLLLCCSVALAQEFTVNGNEYKVIDSNKKWVEIVSVGEENDAEHINLPRSVTKGGVKYTVTRIGKNVIENCSEVTSITIPSSVTSIGDEAFFYLENLTSVSIPNSVTSIGDVAFFGCFNLTDVIIPSSVTSIGKEAFSGCGITSVYISRNLKNIGKGAFGLGGGEGIGYESCKDITSIQVDPQNPVYDSRNNCNAIIETKTNTLIQGCQSTVIPEGVTSIKENAFWGCENLESITIPSSVTSIGEEAFWGCTNLASITISEGVTSIGEKAFASCANLKSIIIPSSVREIDYLTFEYCENLESITLPRHLGEDCLQLPEGCNIIWR